MSAQFPSLLNLNFRLRLRHDRVLGQRLAIGLILNVVSPVSPLVNRTHCQGLYLLEPVNTICRQN